MVTINVNSSSNSNNNRQQYNIQRSYVAASCGLLIGFSSLWLLSLLWWPFLWNDVHKVMGEPAEVRRPPSPPPPFQRMRILYIVTSSNEFNTGDKETQKGQDRFMEILLPALLDGVETMIPTYQVDVYLILGYTLSEQKHHFLQDALPNGVGLQVWNQATPIHYEFLASQNDPPIPYLSEASRMLARQHRYVVRDKLPYYDFFMAWEDDMLITKSHIDYYLEFQDDINQLKKSNHPISTSDPSDYNSTAEIGKDQSSPHHLVYWGNLTKYQLDHIMPGFLRVEVLTDPHRPTQLSPGPIQPINRLGGTSRFLDLDPTICCHGNHVGLQGKLAPKYPPSDQLVLWETAIAGLHLRKMPEQSQLLDWVAILNMKGTPNHIPGYWSGTNGALLPEFAKKPPAKIDKYIGQPAGWMATAHEVMQLNYNLCKGKSFLPPFDEPYLRLDGLGFATDSVEFWSGGLQLWGQMCEIQRLVSLHPRLFSKHLIYHTANNKQKEIEQDRLIKVTTLLGQLHSVQAKAQASMTKQSSQLSILLSRLFRWS